MFVRRVQRDKQPEAPYCGFQHFLGLHFYLIDGIAVFSALEKPRPNRRRACAYQCTV